MTLSALRKASEKIKVKDLCGKKGGEFCVPAVQAPLEVITGVKQHYPRALMSSFAAPSAVTSYAWKRLIALTALFSSFEGTDCGVGSGL